MPPTPPSIVDERRKAYFKVLQLEAPILAALADWPELDVRLAEARRVKPSRPELSAVDLVMGQIQTESGGNPFARGTAGELGLMQLMPSTARDMGLDIPPSGFTPEAVYRWSEAARLNHAGSLPPLIFLPEVNIKAGVGYMHRVYLLLRARGWSGDAFSTYRLALAGYNGGPAYILAAIKNRIGEEMLDEAPVLQAIRESRVKLGGTKRMSDGKVMPVERTAPPAMARYPETVFDHAAAIATVRAAK